MVMNNSTTISLCALIIVRNKKPAIFVYRDVLSYWNSIQKVIYVINEDDLHGTCKNLILGMLVTHRPYSQKRVPRLH